jgi:hypothetical protein
MKRRTATPIPRAFGPRPSRAPVLAVLATAALDMACPERAPSAHAGRSRLHPPAPLGPRTAFMVDYPHPFDEPRGVSPAMGSDFSAQCEGDPGDGFDGVECLRADTHRGWGVASMARAAGALSRFS